MAVYFDNNATTFQCKESIKQKLAWEKQVANPSGSSQYSVHARALIDSAIKFVQKLCNAYDYSVIFTSGATESNSTIIRSAIDAWYRKSRDIKPHVILSSTEHMSLILTARALVDTGHITLTLIQPNSYGQISPKAVASAIQDNTCIVSIMGANNETGAINPISKISEECHKRKVPFHSDCVQLFGKHRLDLPALGIDAMSVSFHKLYGPTGVGMLVIRNSFMKGYNLQGQIAGSQQGGFRGGTENVAGIAGGLAAMRHNFSERAAKNKHLSLLKNTLLSSIDEFIPVRQGVKLSELPLHESKQYVVVIGPPITSSSSLPNTVLFSVVDGTRNLCNGKLKSALEKAGFIVSIGSACNTESKHASHVLQAVGAPPEVKRGTLRISFGDYNTVAQAKKFGNILHKCLRGNVYRGKDEAT